jgi:uncharacterized protein YjgD (DUF1641 family)
MKADTNLQDQIDLINSKLDRVLEFVEHQHLKREEFDDLVEDVSIVAKDVFKNTVQTLDKAGIELDPCGLECLVVRLLRNMGTFIELLDMMESFRDFLKDATPIFHQVGLDAVEKFHEFERKGYIDFVMQLGGVAEKFMQAFTAEDLRRLGDNMDQVAGMLKNLSDPALLAALNRSTRALTEVRPDDKADDLSWWKIAMKMKSPEVRKSVSYSLRLLEAINQKQ